MAWRAPAALAAALAALTAAVVVGGELPGERRLLEGWHGLDPLWRVVDTATGYRPMAASTAVLAVGLVVIRRRWEALLAVASFAGAVAGTTLLKHVVERTRPDGLPSWAAVSTYSFPSGHATATAALALVVVLAARHSRRVWGVALLLVVLAGWAQVAAGLHFPSDVLAGWLWAAAWTTAVWGVAGRRRRLDAT